VTLVHRTTSPALLRLDAELRALGERQRRTRAAGVALGHEARRRILAGEDQAAVERWYLDETAKLGQPDARRRAA